MIISSSDVNNKVCQLAIWKSTNYVNLSHIQIWQISAIYDENKLEIQTNIRYGYKGKASTNTKSKQQNKKEQKENNRKKNITQERTKTKASFLQSREWEKKVLNWVSISCLIHYTHHDVVIQKPNMKTEAKKSLKISKGQPESVYRRRTDNTMVKRKSTKGQTTIYKTYI